MFGISGVRYYNPVGSNYFLFVLKCLLRRSSGGQVTAKLAVHFYNLPEKVCQTLWAEKVLFLQEQNLRIVCDDKTEKWCLCPTEGSTSSMSLTAALLKVSDQNCCLVASVFLHVTCWNVRSDQKGGFKLSSCLPAAVEKSKTGSQNLEKQIRCERQLYFGEYRLNHVHLYGGNVCWICWFYC